MILPDQEIPEDILKEMDSDRIKQLRKAGKIASETSAEEKAKIMAKIRRNLEKKSAEEKAADK